MRDIVDGAYGAVPYYEEENDTSGLIVGATGLAIV
jgi:hypothetical protein